MLHWFGFHFRGPIKQEAIDVDSPQPVKRKLEPSLKKAQGNSTYGDLGGMGTSGAKLFAQLGDSLDDPKIGDLEAAVAESKAYADAQGVEIPETLSGGALSSRDSWEPPEDALEERKEACFERFHRTMRTYTRNARVHVRTARRTYTRNARVHVRTARLRKTFPPPRNMESPPTPRLPGADAMGVAAARNSLPDYS